MTDKELKYLTNEIKIMKKEKLMLNNKLKQINKRIETLIKKKK